MKDLDPIFVNIPCPTKEEGIKLCTEMLQQDLCGTAKVYDHVTLLYKTDTVQKDDVVVLSLKTTQINLPKIHEFILKNHSWGTPCIEVVPILSDMC